MKGNVVDLAVAVVIGAASSTVISSLVKDLLTPLIAALVGKPDFSALYFTINGSRFTYGNFINALVGFVLVSAAIYYVVIVPMSALTRRTQTPTTHKCPECLSEIPLQARRCAHCASDISPSSLARTG